MCVGIRFLPLHDPKRLNFFERYLTLWLGLGMVSGIAGDALDCGVASQIEFGRGSQVNLPIAVLIWLMTRLMARRHPDDS